MSVLQVHSASYYAVKVLAVKGKKCLVEWAYDEEDKDSVAGQVTENFPTRSMSKWDTRYNLGKSLASHPHTADCPLAGC